MSQFHSQLFHSHPLSFLSQTNLRGQPFFPLFAQNHILHHHQSLGRQFDVSETNRKWLLTLAPTSTVKFRWKEQVTNRALSTETNRPALKLTQLKLTTFFAEVKLW